MYQIEGTYQVEDYQQANYLHATHKLFKNIYYRTMWFIVMACSILSYIAFIVIVDGWMPFKIILWVLMIFILFYFILIYLYLPWRTRKIFAQQKELHLPFKIQISETGVYFENSLSQTTRPWNMFTKWKQGQKIMMLYHSDVMFSMLPKRLLTTEIVDFVREQLKKNNIPEK